MALPLLLGALAFHGLAGYMQNKYRGMLNDEATANRERVGGLLSNAQDKAFIYGMPGTQEFNQAMYSDLARNPETAKFGFEGLQGVSQGMLQKSISDENFRRQLDVLGREQGFRAGESLLDRQATADLQTQRIGAEDQRRAAEAAALGGKPPELNLNKGYEPNPLGGARPIRGTPDWLAGQSELTATNMDLRAYTDYQKSLSTEEGAEATGKLSRQQLAKRYQVVNAMRRSEKFGTLDQGSQDFINEMLGDPSSLAAGGYRLKDLVDVYVERQRLTAEQVKQKYKGWDIDTELHEPRTMEGLIAVPSLAEHPFFRN